MAFGRWVRASIAPWNLIGLADPTRRNLYPVDLATLRRRSSLLGLTIAEMEALLPRLRGGGGAGRALPAAASRIE